jgi:hypothetical protein
MAGWNPLEVLANNPYYLGQSGTPSVRRGRGPYGIEMNTLGDQRRYQAAGGGVTMAPGTRATEPTPGPQRGGYGREQDPVAARGGTGPASGWDNLPPPFADAWRKIAGIPAPGAPSPAPAANPMTGIAQQAAGLAGGFTPEWAQQYLPQASPIGVQLSGQPMKTAGKFDATGTMPSTEVPLAKSPATSSLSRFSGLLNRG